MGVLMTLRWLLPVVAFLLLDAVFAENFDTSACAAYDGSLNMCTCTGNPITCDFDSLDPNSTGNKCVGINFVNCDVACTGFAACKEANFEGTSKATCSVENACELANFFGMSSAECTATLSCKLASFSGSSKATCSDAANACQEANFSALSEAHCTFSEACRLSQFSGSSEVSCDVDQACEGVLLSENAQVSCSGTACDPAAGDTWTGVTTADANDNTCCISVTANACPSSITTCPEIAEGDPMVMGFRRQIFLFKGFNAWFAALAEKHLQWNWRLHLFPTCEDGAMPTYVTSTAFTFPASDDVAESRVEVEVIDVDKYNPDYIPGEESSPRSEQILGYGSLRLSIEGKQIVKPGLYSMANGGTVMAFNAFGPCQLKRDLHMMEELNEAERLKTSRRLSEMAVDDDLKALMAVEYRLSEMEDRALCEAWIADKRLSRNLYNEPGSWASVYIFTDTYSFQVDYRQEVERCEAHVLDVSFIHRPNDVGVETWSGVMGETQRLKHDSQGKPIVRDRDLILSSSRDEDYLVDGPWGTDFVARHDSAWEQKTRSRRGLP